MAEQKSFQPSAKRLTEARRRGQTLKSPIITQLAVLIAVLSSAVGLIRYSWVRSVDLLNYCFNEGVSKLEVCSHAAAAELVTIVGGSLGAGALAAVVVEGLQVGVVFEASPLGCKLERCDPVAGMKRLVAGIGRGWRSAVIVVALGWVLSKVVSQTVHEALSAYSLAKGALEAWSFHRLMMLVGYGVVTLALAGIGEYLLNRRAFYRDLSMSADEVRREHKEDEGDPHIKAVRRAQHEALILQDIERRVKQARVVVVERNDTESVNSS